MNGFLILGQIPLNPEFCYLFMLPSLSSFFFSGLSLFLFIFVLCFLILWFEMGNTHSWRCPSPWWILLICTFCCIQGNTCYRQPVSVVCQAVCVMLLRIINSLLILSAGRRRNCPVLIPHKPNMFARKEPAAQKGGKACVCVCTRVRACVCVQVCIYACYLCMQGGVKDRVNCVMHC